MSANADEAVELFKSGYNCSQSVFASCSKDFPISRETALTVAGAFGGGLGSTGNACGAVTGAVMAIGMKCPRLDPKNQQVREESIRLTRELIARFKERNGSIECRELLCQDLSVPEQARKAKETGLFQSLCPKYVRDAAEILDEILA